MFHSALRDPMYIQVPETIAIRFGMPSLSLFLLLPTSALTQYAERIWPNRLCIRMEGRIAVLKDQVYDTGRDKGGERRQVTLIDTEGN
jgi:hypothetical protein